MANISLPLLSALLWAVGLCLIGGLMTPRGPWYASLRKPPWQPPGWAFGPAWTLILGLAAWAGVRAWDVAMPAQQVDILIVFGVNALFHMLWSPLFFRAERPDWALGEVPFLWASVLAMLVALWPIDRTAALLILPYLFWVTFAARLNLEIVRRNPQPRPFPLQF
ncbi:MAG: TspO protein [Alphaproteobacteria bacterium PA4]|nr:MAG: TspO protein [Alphaproteobacteria bacterium PA4]